MQLLKRWKMVIDFSPPGMREPHRPPSPYEAVISNLFHICKFFSRFSVAVNRSFLRSSVATPKAASGAFPCPRSGVTTPRVGVSDCTQSRYGNKDKSILCLDSTVPDSISDCSPVFFRFWFFFWNFFFLSLSRTSPPSHAPI